MYHYKEEIAPVTRHCDRPGCEEPGEHRAPKTRGEAPDYYWFCLEHVREYNKQWDYFSGMSREEIEDFQKDAAFGHRPTWSQQMRASWNTHTLHTRLREFMHGTGNGEKHYPPPIPEKYRKALDILDLAHPVARPEIKARYKVLVKQYHPDVNQGDKMAEERFKTITASYRLLIEEYAP